MSTSANETSNYLSWDQLVELSNSCPMESMPQWIALHASLLKPMVDSSATGGSVTASKIEPASSLRIRLLQLQYEFVVVRKLSSVLAAFSQVVLPLLFSSSTVDLEFGKAAILATYATLSSSTGTSTTLDEVTSCLEYVATTKIASVEQLELRSFFYIQLQSWYQTNTQEQNEDGMDKIVQAIHDTILHVIESIATNNNNATNWMRPVTAMLLPAVYPTAIHSNHSTDRIRPSETQRTTALWEVLQQLMKDTVATYAPEYCSKEHDKSNTSSVVVATGVLCVTMPYLVQNLSSVKNWMEEELFWKFLQVCLSTSVENTIVRRRALYILQTLFDYTPTADSCSRVWKQFVLCYEALEMEVEVHLIDQIWPTVLELCHTAALNTASTSSDNVTSSSTMTWKWISLLLSRVFLTDNPSIRKWALYRFLTGDAGISMDPLTPFPTPQKQEEKPTQKKKSKKSAIIKPKIEAVPMSLVEPEFVLEVLLPSYDSVGPAVGTGLQVPKKDGSIVTENITPHMETFLRNYMTCIASSSKATLVHGLLTEAVLEKLRMKTCVFVHQSILSSLAEETKIYISKSTLEQAHHCFVTYVLQKNIVHQYRLDILQSLAVLLAHSTSTPPHPTTAGTIPYSHTLLLQVFSLFPSPISTHSHHQEEEKESLDEKNICELLQLWLENLNSSTGKNGWISEVGAACASAFVSGQLLPPTTSEEEEVVTMSKVERDMGAAIVKFCAVASLSAGNAAASEWLWPAIRKGISKQHSWSAGRACILIEYGCNECVLSGIGHGDLIVGKGDIMMPPPPSIESILQSTLLHILHQVRMVSFGSTSATSSSSNTVQSEMTKHISKSLTIYLQQLRILAKAYPSSQVLPTISNHHLTTCLQEIHSFSNGNGNDDSHRKLHLVKNMSCTYALLTCGAQYNYIPNDCSNQQQEEKTHQPENNVPSLLDISTELLNMNFSVSRKKSAAGEEAVSPDIMRAARSIFQYAKWGILSFFVPMLHKTYGDNIDDQASSFYRELLEVALDSVQATPSDSLLPLFETATATARILSNSKKESIKVQTTIVQTLFAIMEDTTHSPTKMYMLQSICSILFRTKLLQDEYHYLEEEFGSDFYNEKIDSEDAPILGAFQTLLKMAGTFKPHIAKYAVSYITAAWTKTSDAAESSIPYRRDIANLLIYKEAKLDDATIHQEGLVKRMHDNHEDENESLTTIPKGTNKLSVVRAFMLVFISRLPDEPSDIVLKELCHYLIFWLLDDVLLTSNPDQKKNKYNHKNDTKNKKSNKKNNNSNKKKSSGNAMIMTGSEEYCQKIRAWQALCILSRFVTGDIASSVMEKALETLSVNMHGQIRSFSEVFLLQCARRHPIEFASLLTREIQRRDLTVQHISSLMVMAGNLLVGKYSQDFLPNIDDKCLRPIIAGILPYLSSTQSFSRGIAQLLVHKLIPLVIDTTSTTTASDDPMGTNDWYLQSMWRFLEENQEMKRLRKKQVSFCNGYDIDELCTPEGLLQLKVDEGDEANPTHMVESIKRTLEEVYKEGLEEGDDGDTPMWYQMEQLLDNMDTKTTHNHHDGNAEDDSTLVNFQRKILPLDTLHLSMNEEDDSLRNIHVNAAGRNRQELIVCASLIDKVPNLAGLARTAEIFAAQKLVLPDVSVAKMDNFTSISVGAGDWIQMEECKEKDLLAWLNRQKESGYTIVGIEQTSSSKCLSDLEFPKKTVLLLGKEKEGIPVQFLQVVDVCVEIPQLGLIRSLNVHVSGAISIWEYTKQMMRLEN